jgi:hypothetical protein
MLRPWVHSKCSGNGSVNVRISLRLCCKSRNVNHDVSIVRRCINHMFCDFRWCNIHRLTSDVHSCFDSNCSSAIVVVECNTFEHHRVSFFRGWNLNDWSRWPSSRVVWLCWVGLRMKWSNLLVSQIPFQYCWRVSIVRNTLDSRWSTCVDYERNKNSL